MTPDECQYVLDIDAVLSEALSDNSNDGNASLLLQQLDSSNDSHNQYSTAHTDSSSGGHLGSLKLEYQSASIALQVDSSVHAHDILRSVNFCACVHQCHVVLRCNLLSINTVKRTVH
jgi:hypothetical protein